MMLGLLVGAFLGAQAADTVTTCRLPPAHYREANPFLPQSHAGIAALKLGVAGVSVVAVWKASTHHPRLKYLLLAGIASGAYGAAHNANLRRGQ